MVPAVTRSGETAAPVDASRRIYLPNGPCMDDWTPATEGRGFDALADSAAARALPRSADVVSGLDNLQATDQGDVGGQHLGRAVFHERACTRSRPKASDVAGRHDDRSGVGDEILRATRQLPSLEVCVESSTTASARATSGTACAYLNTISWRTPTHAAADGDQPARRLRADVRRIGATPSSAPARLRKRIAACSTPSPEEIAGLAGALGSSDRLKLASSISTPSATSSSASERRAQQQRVAGARAAGRRARRRTRSTSS